MPLNESTLSVVENLRRGRYSNEQAISQGIVLRLLQDLGWNTWDTTKVWPEFQTGEGRVDFALCHPESQPAVFVEVKQPGRAEEGVRQALEYAFHTGVPFVVLTDGKTWSFYLPAEKGSYEERRVYKLDLFERSSEEVVARLTEYLQHDRVISGAALEAAREQYRTRNKQAFARQTIPTAWQELIGEGEPVLVELVQNAVEAKCGIRPDGEDVLHYFRATPLVQTPKTNPAIPLPSPNYERPAGLPISPLPTSRAGTVKLDGKEMHVRNAQDATLLILRTLAQKDSSFLTRCASHPDNFGRKRAYIARTTEELFPDRPDLGPKHEVIADGWLLNTNVNNQIKTRIVRVACEVAGLVFGTDVRIDF